MTTIVGVLIYCAGVVALALAIGARYNGPPNSITAIALSILVFYWPIALPIAALVWAAVRVNRVRWWLRWLRYRHLLAQSQTNVTLLIPLRKGMVVTIGGGGRSDGSFVAGQSEQCGSGYQTPLTPYLAAHGWWWQ